MNEIREVIGKVLSALKEWGCDNIEISLRADGRTAECILHSKFGSKRETVPLHFFMRDINEVLFTLALACIHYRYLHKFAPFLYVDKHYRYLEVFVNNRRIVYARYNPNASAVQLHYPNRVSLMPVRDFVLSVMALMETYRL